MPTPADEPNQTDLLSAVLSTAPGRPVSDSVLLALLLKVGHERVAALASDGLLDGDEIGAWLLLARLGGIDELPIPSGAFATDKDKVYLADEFLPREVAKHSAIAGLLINLEWMADLDVERWAGFGAFMKLEQGGLDSTNAVRYVTLDAVTPNDQSSQRARFDAFGSTQQPGAATGAKAVLADGVNRPSWLRSIFAKDQRVPQPRSIEQFARDLQLSQDLP